MTDKKEQQIYVGRLNFENVSWGQYCFSITQRLNTELDFKRISSKYDKLVDRFPDKYLPLFKKQFKDKDYFRIQGKLSPKIRKKPKRGELYKFSFNILKQKNNGNLTAIFNTMEAYTEPEIECSVVDL